VIRNRKDLRLDFSNQQDQWIKDIYGILNWTGENYDREKLRLIKVTSSKEQRMKKQNTNSFGRKWKTDSQTIVR
jgi:acetolactate synthase small subunit